VIGLGLNLVLASDFAVVAEDARLRAPFTGLGFTPDSGASWLVVSAMLAAGVSGVGVVAAMPSAGGRVSTRTTTAVQPATAKRSEATVAMGHRLLRSVRLGATRARRRCADRDERGGSACGFSACGFSACGFSAWGVSVC